MLGPVTSKLAAVATTAVLVAVILAALLLPQAQGAFPGRNGALLVAGVAGSARGDWCAAGPPRLVGRVADDSGYCSDGTSVWLAGPGRAGVRRLWRARGFGDYFTAGGFSPDGRSVVFGEVTDVNGLIFGPGLAGARLRVLPLRGASPAWTAGGRISYTGDDGSLYIARPGGTPKRRAQESPGDGVRWSSTGRWAAVVGVQELSGPSGRVLYEGTELWVSDRHGRRQAASGVRGAEQFDWAPDGRSLVVARLVKGKGRALYAVRRDGVIRSRLTAFVRDESDQPQEPRWSPDGRLIAFRYRSRVVVTAARARRPQGPSAWRTVVRGCASLLDWQALPPSGGGR